MKGIEFLMELQKKLGLNDFIVANCKVTYENAVARKLDAKHDIYALASAVVYLFAKRNGVNITLNLLCENSPATREEVMDAYEDLRKVF